MTETMTVQAFNALDEHSPARKVTCYSTADRPELLIELRYGKPLPPSANYAIMNDDSCWELTGEKWRRVAPKIEGADITGATVGDITSDKRGTGARYNGDKVPFQYIPVGVLTNAIPYLPEQAGGSRVASALSLSLESLANFQEGNDEAIHEAVAHCFHFLDDSARVFEYGAKKYAEWNWLKGMPWSVVMGCAWRHAMAILEGDLTDNESGLPHMGHYVCNLVMLAQFVDSYPEGDDRPPSSLFNGPPVTQEAEVSSCPSPSST